MERSDAVLSNEYMGTLDRAIERLQELREQGQNVYINFNGHKLYSCDASEEVVYQEMYGMSKKEHEEDLARRRAEWEKQEAERKAKEQEETKGKIPEWQAALKEIPGKGLDERHFYEEVLKVMKTMGVPEFTEESLGELQSTLREIGCMPYDEWVEQQDPDKRPDPDEKLYDAIGRGSISGAVSIVTQLFNNPESASFGMAYTDDRELADTWIQASERLHDQKESIPYYQVAKQALMNWGNEQSNWQPIPEEEALEIIERSSFEEIDRQVGAKKSMDHAIEGIYRSLEERSGISLGTRDYKRLEGYVYEGGESPTIENWKHRMRLSDPERLGFEGAYNLRENTREFNEIMMDTLFAVHDGWVEDNPSKFTKREKKHQHMPSELIGWEEAKADLLFIRPIFEGANIPVDEEQLKEVYMERVKDFFLEHGLRTTDDLAALIAQGPDFYPPLAGYGDEIRDPEVIKGKIIPQIEEKGIGKVEDVRRQIIERIKANPTPEDLARLTEEERAEVEESLSHDVGEMTEQRDELHAKNDVVGRIMSLSKRRKDLKKEIEQEQQKKDETVQGDNN